MKATNYKQLSNNYLIIFKLLNRRYYPKIKLFNKVLKNICKNYYYHFINKLITMLLNSHFN
jgi:hypothetical protein